MNKITKKVMGTMMAALMATTTVGVLPVSADYQMMYISESSSDGRLNKTYMDLTKGYQFTLKLDGSTSGLTYTSADSSVATVNSEGKVVGKNVGGTVIYVSDGKHTYSCTVNVVATKISASKTSYTLKEGETAKVTVTVKGKKKLRVTSSDKSVASASWVKPWNGNDITLKIKANGEGSAVLKLYNPDYPSTYTSIKVTVPSSETFSTTTTSVSTSVGLSYRFYVNSNSGSIVVSSKDPSIAAVSAVPKSGGYAIDVTGCSAGSTSITISNKNNKNESVTIPVTVDGASLNPYAKYYVERVYNLTNPSAMTIEARSASDKIVYWPDKKSSQLMYAVVPYNYIPENGEYCIPLSTVVDTNVCSYDGDDYYWFSRDNSRYYFYRNLDIAHPQNNPVTVEKGEKLVWRICTNGYVQYMILPEYAAVDFSRYEYVLNWDGSSYYITTDYYRPVSSCPRKKLASDSILSYSHGGKMIYVLVPANYDRVRVSTSVAKETGVYLYYTVYSSKPSKMYSTDIIIDYENDVVGETRYILVPRNYNEDKVDELIDNDLNTVPVTTLSNAQETIEAINAERKESGIKFLGTDDALTKAAEIRAVELSKRFSHKRPDGTSYITALEETGVIYSSPTEIILSDVKYPSDVVAALFDDSDYRDEVLSSLNKKIGVVFNTSKHYCVIILTD